MLVLFIMDNPYYLSVWWRFIWGLDGALTGGFGALERGVGRGGAIEGCGMDIGGVLLCIYIGYKRFYT